MNKKYTEKRKKLIKENQKTQNKRLDLGNCDLRDLEKELPELFDCIWLEELSLSRNAITNFKCLERLSNLSALSLRSNRIICNINDLVNIEKLTQLDLSACEINNIDFLKNFSHLESIYLRSNRINNIDFLKNLNELKKIDLSINNIYDISCLENLTKLKHLFLNTNKILDVKILKRLINLETLNLRHNLIRDISSLVSLHKLQELDLSSNEISTIDTLLNIKELQSVDLRYNSIGNNCILENLSKLQILDLRYNQINNLKLHNLNSLRVVNAIRNPIEKINFTNLQQIKELNFDSLGLKEIYIENLPRLNKFKVNNNSINNIYISKADRLYDLNISSNQIKDISFLEKLPQLHTLNLSSNNIEKIHFSQKLPQLHTLNLSLNQIKSIHFSQKLPQLHTLNLSSNQIEDIRFLGKFPHLHSLDLNSNKIKDISFLKNFPHLYSLDLSSNQISDITPILVFLKKGFSVTLNKYSNDNIKLANNPLQIPPIEIINEGNQAIFNYFEELESGSETVYEAKLLIIGEAGAGKTSLKLKIGNRNATLPTDSDTTTGIEITTHTFTAKDDFPEFTMNIWDFGGQEVYHATHQFFLSKRSLYVLVDDGRKEDRNDYWLQIQELLAEDSPLLLLVNKKATIQRKIALNVLKNEFANIRDLNTIDLKNESNKINKFCHTIEYHIRNLPQFKNGETLPRKWVHIRETLEKTNKNYISLNEYRQLCRREGIIEIKRQDFLSDYLHDLGIMLHFQDSPLLKRIVILKPEWATNAVYAILNHTEEKCRDGQFSYTDLNEVWQSNEYQYVFEQLLELMEKFELCYRLKQDNNRFIVPQLLPKEKPHYEWNYTNNLQLRYEYDFKPKGMIARFIVRRHKFIENQDLVWQLGVVLKYKNARAQVIEEYRTNAINIYVDGKFPQDLMSIITDEIDDINSGFHFNERMKVRKMVPCICRKCRQNSKPELYIYEKLMNRLERDKPRYYCNTGDEFFNIMDALYNIGEKKDNRESNTFTHTTTPHQNKHFPKKIFISYSKLDSAYLTKFKTYLSTLKYNNNIVTWDNSDVALGEEWNEQTQEKLEEADIIILLVSVNFLVTKEIELKIAEHKSSKGEAVIIPIIIRTCPWSNTSFAKYKVLPDKGKAIDTWTNADEAWTNVVESIANILK